MRGVTKAFNPLTVVFAFLLTRLMRGVTDNVKTIYGDVLFLLTRLMRGVTEKCREKNKAHCISTHTPHARRDLQTT